MLIIIILLPAVFLSSACTQMRTDDNASHEEAPVNAIDIKTDDIAEQSQDYEPEQISIGESEMWRVKLLSAEMTSSLITTRASLQ